MRSWVADYQIVQSLGSEDDIPARLLARPPRRLGVGSDVVLHVFEGLGAEKSESLIHRLQALASIRSPGLSLLFEAGQSEQDGRPEAYYSSEYAPAGSLASRAATLSPAGKFRAVADAARAAHDLHEAGLVHGDIRTSTIWLAERGGVLSEPLPIDLTEPGLVLRVGDAPDLEMTDPAIIRGEGRSRASDIWALGATLHAVLTGRLLHPALVSDPPVTAVQRIMYERPVIDRELPESYARLIGSCLAREPLDRPASAADLADRLTALAGAL